MSLYSRYESVSDTDKRSYNIYHSRIAGDKTTILNHERFYLWICVVFFPLWYQNDKCFALCRKEKVWYWLWILCIHATIFERFGKILISTNVYIKGASKHFYFFFFFPHLQFIWEFPSWYYIFYSRWNKIQLSEFLG